MMEPDQQPNVDEVLAQKARKERLSKVERLEKEAREFEEAAAELRKKSLQAKREAEAYRAVEQKRIMAALRDEAGGWALGFLKAKASGRNSFLKHLASLPPRKSEELLKACEALWPASEKSNGADEPPPAQGAEDAPV